MIRRRAWTPYLLFGAVLLALLLIASWGAQAQPGKCFPREVVIATAASAYNETPAAVGHHKINKEVVELLLSDTGSWTIIVSRPDGISCIAATGDQWEQHRVPGQGT